MISKKSVEDLVNVFYQPPHRTFYVNSDSRGNCIRPIGIFVSLGLTSSLSTIERVRCSLESTGEYLAFLAEIASVKDQHGNYLNQVTRMGEDVFKQYKADDTGYALLSREEAVEEVNRLKGELDEISEPEGEILASRIHRLEGLIEKLDESEGWDCHSISKTDDDYSLFHHFVNYLKDQDENGKLIEYRLGIYVVRKVKKK